MADAVPAPDQDEAHEAFLAQCMQEKLDTIPAMSERRTACEAAWQAAHPALPIAAAKPQGTGPAAPPKP